MDLTDAIAALEAEYLSIAQQLAGDAATGTMPSDSFGGQSVDFVAWRAGLYARQKQIREELMAMQPYEHVSQGW